MRIIEEQISRSTENTMTPVYSIIFFIRYWWKSLNEDTSHYAWQQLSVMHTALQAGISREDSFFILAVSRTGKNSMFASMYRVCVTSQEAAWYSRQSRGLWHEGLICHLREWHKHPAVAWTVRLVLCGICEGKKYHQNYCFCFDWFYSF